METAPNGIESIAEKAASPLLLAALVPHRDCLPALEACRRVLFAVGVEGAFSFPAAAPLALLNRPLGPSELTSAAAELRELLGGKKIVVGGQGICGGWAGAEVTGAVRFYGPVLELPSVAFPPDAVVQSWEKPILAPAILASGGSVPPEMPPPAVSFRAAALANLAMKPVSAGAGAEKPGSKGISCFEERYSFTWTMGPLFWLPRYSRQKC